MRIIVKEDKDRELKEIKNVHGNFPYKYYFETNNIKGVPRFIMIHSDNELIDTDKMNELVIELADCDNKNIVERLYNMELAKKAGVISSMAILCRIKQINVLDILNEKVTTYEFYRS